MSTGGDRKEKLESVRKLKRKSVQRGEQRTPSPLSSNTTRIHVCLLQIKSDSSAREYSSVESLEALVPLTLGRKNSPTTSVLVDIVNPAESGSNDA